MRREIVLAAALSAVFFSAIPHAAEYPTRPLRFVIGFAPGGASDTMVRVIGARLSENLRQPVIIDNRPGAGGNIAAEIAAEAAGIEAGKLLDRAKSPAIEKHVRASTAEFGALQITQRPAFVIDTEIGDRAIFSGVVKLEPLTATIDSMLDDAAAYAAHKAHFGDPPAK